MPVKLYEQTERLLMQPTTPAVDKAMIHARAGLGLLVENGWTLAELREAVFNGFRSHEEAEEDGFDMSSDQQCILGRAVGDYADGASLLGLTLTDQTDDEDNRASINHGFLVLSSGDEHWQEQDGDYNYGDLAQAWERILVPEWWAVPKTKTLRIMVDVVVPADDENAKTAYQTRDLIESFGDFQEVSLYSWTDNVDENEDEDLY